MSRLNLSEDLPGRTPPKAKPTRRIPVIGMTVDETAEALGLSPRTVADLVRNGEIPAARVGTRWIISPKAVQRWLEKRSEGGTP